MRRRTVRNESSRSKLTEPEILPTPDHPEGVGGTALTLSSVSEDSEEEEADTLAEGAERAGEGDRPLPRFPPERDLSRPDECLRRRSGREDFRTRSHQPGKAVAEAAPVGVDTPRAGIADEQATRAADVTGAVGPGSTPAPVTPAADNKDPTAASRCATGPDRLRNRPTGSRKENVGRGMEPPATTGPGSTINPESPQLREATTASLRSR